MNIFKVKRRAQSNFNYEKLEYEALFVCYYPYFSDPKPNRIKAFCRAYNLYKPIKNKEKSIILSPQYLPF